MQGLLVLSAVGLIAQLIDGALGMAYGATSATLILAAGVSPAAASASVHLAELGTTLMAGASHWRFGNVHWQTVRRMAIPGAVGAFAGAVVLSSISSEAAAPWMAGVLLSLGVYVLVRFTVAGVPRREGRRYVRGRFLAPLGLFAGFIDASGGGGWGPVATPTLLASGRMEPRKVIGSVDTSEFLVALAASLGFLVGLGTQGIAWQYVAPLLIGGLLAAPIAAWLVRKFPPRMLGSCVGGLIILTNLRTLFDAFAIDLATRRVAYALLMLVWAAAIGVSLAQHRRDVGRPRTELATATV